MTLSGLVDPRKPRVAKPARGPTTLPHYLSPNPPKEGLGDSP